MKPQLELSRHLERLKVLAPAGFAIALHVRFTTPGLMFQTYPAAWIEEYTRSGFLMRDPSVRWNFTNEGAMPWSELEAEDEAGVFAKAAEYGLRHGIAISILRGASRSIAGYARADRPFHPPEVEELRAEMEALHEMTAEGRPLPRGIEGAMQQLGIDFTHG
jgi:LuxR family transcriptional regulator